MPWMANLFIGEILKTDEDVRAEKTEKDWAASAERVKKRAEAIYTKLGIPLPEDEESFGEVMEADIKHGRLDPFAIDLTELAYVLHQVREWWPEAQVFIWDRHY